jgi:hypothetical protein
MVTMDETEIRSTIDLLIPKQHVIMCCEGGGPEDLKGTLALSVSRMAVFTQRYDKLRKAVIKANFGIMETSGEWSIHDMSEGEKAACEAETRTIMENIEYAIENRKLKEKVAKLEELLNHYTRV